MNHEEHEHCGCGHEHHHHESHEHCSCGHEHHHHESHEHCECGHEHHHHESHEHCECGHEHHHHESHEHCECGHEHHHEHHEHEIHGKTTVFLIENLGCANCAAKMEAKIKQMNGIDDAVITFATKQLKVKAKHPEKYLSEFQKICQSIEPDVKVIIKDDETKASVKKETYKREIAEIIIGAVLFIAGQVLIHNGFETVSIAVFIVGYIALGWHVLLTAWKNILRGNLFDENFLMAVATIGAFCIKEWPEAVGVMLFYRIGEIFEHIAVSRSRSQIMEAVDLRPETVQVLHDQQTKTMLAKDVQIGEIMIVRPGDRIPLDGIVIEGESRLDTSPVTGESKPVAVEKDAHVLSGCLNINGLLKIKVEKVLEESMVTKILNAVENAASSKPVVDRFITKFAKIYTPIVILIALITAIIPSIFTGNWNHWVYTALTFLVMSCPCALVLSVPLAFFSGIGMGSKLGILFKGGVAIESLSRIKAIIMDKTGTITKGNFVVQKIINTEASNDSEVLKIAVACEKNSSHPIAESIREYAKGLDVEIIHLDEVQEIAGYGIVAKYNNSLVLCGNKKLLEKHNVTLSGFNENVAATEVYVAKNGNYIGKIIISDTIKDDAKKTIMFFKKKGLFTVMLTGDKDEVAKDVADQIGIDQVYAQLLPTDKLSRLEEIRNSHGEVMFIGDGINDAPVLAGANVGAAMGSGADAAIEAADVVFMTSSMNAVKQAILLAKKSTAVAWQNIIFAIAIKVIVMILGLTCFSSMWLAVFADTGVAMLCVLNSIRLLLFKEK